MSRDTLYVTNGNSGTISVFAIEAGGVLEPVASTETPDGPRGIVFTGGVAHVVNSGVHQVSTYRAGPRGELTPLGRAVRTDEDPFGIAASPHGDAVYVTSLGHRTVAAFPVRDDGTLVSRAGNQATNSAAQLPAGGVAGSPKYDPVRGRTGALPAETRIHRLDHR
ncbi:beta-propeller fold lactonase family protein, partial [Actinophytocola sp.]|uniref:beta-propeller fold lactonase family protein n=1 Tax=Actinophytocola sp. TaxID=1872138 RepID=UPI002D71AF59